jgi:hypothetical protein
VVFYSVDTVAAGRFGVGADGVVGGAASRRGGGELAALNTRDFDIQASTDASTWTTVATVVGNVAKVTTHEFAPTSARYLKLNVTTPTSNGECGCADL